MIRDIIGKLLERAMIPLIMGLGLSGAFLAMVAEVFTWAEVKNPARERE